VLEGAIPRSIASCSSASWIDQLDQLLMRSLSEAEDTRHPANLARAQCAWSSCMYASQPSTLRYMNPKNGPTLQAKQYKFTIAPAALAPLPCVSWCRREAVGGTATDAAIQSEVSAAMQCWGQVRLSCRSCHKHQRWIRNSIVSVLASSRVPLSATLYQHLCAGRSRECGRSALCPHLPKGAATSSHLQIVILLLHCCLRRGFSA
jgi:hypothetical protein